MSIVDVFVYVNGDSMATALAQKITRYTWVVFGLFYWLYMQKLLTFKKKK